MSESKQKPRRIIALQSQNVKRLSAVHIKPDGNVVIVGGKNGAGKSSVLDSIIYALAGGKNIPKVPIRRGAETAEVTVDLGDIIVRRTFSDSGSRLAVTTHNGATLKSPQALLDKLTQNGVAFDPEAFSRMKPADQVEQLKKVVGLDFSDLNLKRQSLYEQRTDVNRDIKRTQANMTEVTVFDDVPADGKPLSVSDLTVELEKRRDHNQAIARKAEQIQARQRTIATANERKEQLADEIADLEKRLAEKRAALQRGTEQTAQAEAELKQWQSELDAAVRADEDEVRERIKNVESINNRLKSNLRRKELKEELDQLQSESDKLSRMIDEIDKDKQVQLAKAPFPVTGMTFDEDGILLDGIPFDQASSAEKLRASVAMGMAINPELKVLIIRDGSLLDEDSLKLVADMAAEHDAQVWIERVGTGEECQVIIEDGAVREPEPALV
jgi:DNA repair exonuclease SbcCD ATPase subunit